MCLSSNSIQTYWTAVKKINSGKPLSEYEREILAKNNYPFQQETNQRSEQLS